MNKLKSRAGETLVELLLSMLIISLGMLMLVGAITTTARLNKATENFTRAGNVKPPDIGDTGDTGDTDTGDTRNPRWTVTAAFQVDTSTLGDIQLREEGGVYYYEKTTS